MGTEGSELRGHRRPNEVHGDACTGGCAVSEGWAVDNGLTDGVPLGQSMTFIPIDHTLGLGLDFGCAGPYSVLLLD